MDIDEDVKLVVGRDLSLIMAIGCLAGALDGNAVAERLSATAQMASAVSRIADALGLSMDEVARNGLRLVQEGLEANGRHAESANLEHLARMVGGGDVH